MNIIFAKREVFSDFRKTLIEPLYQKCDKNEFGYRGNSLVLAESMVKLF